VKQDRQIRSGHEVRRTKPRALTISLVAGVCTLLVLFPLLRWILIRLWESRHGRPAKVVVEQEIQAAIGSIAVALLVFGVIVKRMWPRKQSIGTSR
jgi:hypothetical protein